MHGEGIFFWERAVSRAAWIAVGLGISTWLIFLDYRRRAPARISIATSRRRTSLLNAGLALAALGVGLRWLAGAEPGWSVAGAYLAALAGLGLLAVHFARGLIQDPGGRERTRGRKGPKG